MIVRLCLASLLASTALSGPGCGAPPEGAVEISGDPPRAAPTSPPPPTTTPEVAAGGIPEGFNARQVAFALGERISVGTFAWEAKDDAFAGKQFSQAEVIATATGVTVPPLPARDEDPAKRGAAGLHYLLKGLDGLEAELETKHGPEAVAAFKLASALALLSKWWSDPQLRKTLARGVATQAERARVPADVMKPLQDAIAADPDSIVKDVMACKSSVATYFASSTAAKDP